MSHYDVIVIGSGPGGEGAAMTLSKQGKTVALVEKHNQVGGGCTHWGTIPSKALRHAVQLLADYRHHPLFEHTLTNVDVTYPQLLQTADAVRSKQVSMRHRFYVRNNIDIYHGIARFEDAHTIDVERENGATERLSADYFVIAHFMDVIRKNQPAPIDAYDSAAWSAIIPLSAQSLREGNTVQDIPDFTGGKWKTRK